MAKVSRAGPDNLDDLATVSNLSRYVAYTGRGII